MQNLSQGEECSLAIYCKACRRWKKTTFERGTKGDRPESADNIPRLPSFALSWNVHLSHKVPTGYAYICNAFCAPTCAPTLAPSASDVKGTLLTAPFLYCATDGRIWFSDSEDFGVFDNGAFRSFPTKDRPGCPLGGGATGRDVGVAGTPTLPNTAGWRFEAVANLSWLDYDPG